MSQRVMMEYVDTSGVWLSGINFNKGAIINQLETYEYDIDAIQSVDETNAALEQAIWDYCSKLKLIFNTMLCSAQYDGEGTAAWMVEAWGELTNVVEKLLVKFERTRI